MEIGSALHHPVRKTIIVTKHGNDSAISFSSVIVSVEEHLNIELASSLIACILLFNLPLTFSNGPKNEPGDGLLEIWLP